MTNRDIDAARRYHNHTKHSWDSVRADPHFLDWQNQPRLFKVYRDLPLLALPTPVRQSTNMALSAAVGIEEHEQHDTPISLEDLAGLLYFSAGITRRRSYPGGELMFRAAACTGALYSIELYAVCSGVRDLSAGVYLFSPLDFSLAQIRDGAFREALVRATAEEPAVSRAPVTIVCTGTYWRNAWKYQARTYRHFGWDNGTILANLLAVADARRLPARVVQGYVDEEINLLLGLDTNREVTLSMVPIGSSPAQAAKSPGEVSKLKLDTIPYSPREVDYPLMREIHAASSLHSAEEVAA